MNRQWQTSWKAIAVRTLASRLKQRWRFYRSYVHLRTYNKMVYEGQHNHDEKLRWARWQEVLLDRCFLWARLAAPRESRCSQLLCYAVALAVSSRSSCSARRMPHLCRGPCTVQLYDSSNRCVQIPLVELASWPGLGDFYYPRPGEAPALSSPVIVRLLHQRKLNRAVFLLQFSRMVDRRYRKVTRHA